ncbi:MAG TPA: DUF2281 domain-containing protein [Pyrinomonadaceae bacterium]|nr:DUF2281 domain-containing protein [Pyrinomonadaceae bacterium]
METVIVRIRDPKVKQILKGLEQADLIELEDVGKPAKPRRRFGSMKGLVEHIADDFDAPLEDFEEYM